MKYFIYLLMLLIPALAAAHDGHVSDGSLVHQVEHGIWYLTILLLVITGIWLIARLEKCWSIKKGQLNCPKQDDTNPVIK